MVTGRWVCRFAGQPVKGVIVYFHGSDQNAHVIQDDRKHTDFFDPLLRAGYAVVAADADGNAFGNLASRQDHRQLTAGAKKKYGSAPIFFVAESMGALSALALLGEDTGRQIKGMVGVSPLMGISPTLRSVSFIADAWGGHVPDSADPMGWPPEVFSGRTFRLYVPTEDQVIPASASARPSLTVSVRWRL
jgi:alpha-beta hydrolase superfamily lysophospholipase